MSRDLDWSDVLDDADAMFANMLDHLPNSTPHDLAVLRYRYGPDARQGEPHAVAVVHTIDWIYAGQPEPDYPEYDGYDDDWQTEAYNRELEAESLGRPLFPNEY